MNKIKLLDNKTIQQIAAGEVIERPLSIVKELVENSLDANSDNITIEIKNGGKTYIRVTDNGDGIYEDDLELAFKRHSTSKLSSIEDLYRIRSLGFRGEALASIVHVSKVEVMTKTIDAMAGIHVLVEEGNILSKDVIGCPKGTTFIVRDLFYNIPVRKEFLRSDLTESNQISDMVYKIALGNSNSSFKFIRDNKIVLNTSKNNDMKSHIYSILGKDFANNLKEFDIEEHDIKIRGYISNNTLYRSNRSHQYIYINGRYINNTEISNTIEHHYKSIIPLNRFPCFILFIEIDPKTLDVNIHPTKQEVKFVNQLEIFSVINNAIKNVLYPNIFIPKVNFKENKDKKVEELPLLSLDADSNISQNIIVKDFTKEKTKEEPAKWSPMVLENHIIKENNTMSNYELPKEVTKEKIIDEIEDNKEQEKSLNIKKILSEIKPISSIFNTYIIAEDRINEKLYFIDQHAAHERIMYERYLNEYENENIVSQELIAPEILELTDSEMNMFVKNNLIFKKLGFNIDDFGSNSIAIRSVPLLFGVPVIKKLFYDLLDNIHNINSNYDTKLDKIMKLACTKAIKAGDNVSELEVLSLFNQLKECENPHSCPHGRPTVLEMTKTDIEKAFLRII